APVQPDQAAQADDEVSRALQNPRVLAALQETINAHAAQAEQIGQFYANAAAQNAVMAAASLVAQFPELHNLTPEQIPVAIQTVNRTNPQRAAEMVRHIEQTKALIAEHGRMQQAQAAWQQQQFQTQFLQYAKDEDAKYEEFSLGFSSEQKAEIQNEAISMLRELGLRSDDQIRAEWNTNPSCVVPPASGFLRMPRA